MNIVLIRCVKRAKPTEMRRAEESFRFKSDPAKDPTNAPTAAKVYLAAVVQHQLVIRYCTENDCLGWCMSRVFCNTHLIVQTRGLGKGCHVSAQPDVGTQKGVSHHCTSQN